MLTEVTIGWMDKELYQRPKSRPGRDCGIGILAKCSRLPIHLSSELSSSSTFIFSLLERKLTDESLSQLFLTTLSLSFHPLEGRNCFCAAVTVTIAELSPRPDEGPCGLYAKDIRSDFTKSSPAL